MTDDFEKPVRIIMWSTPRSISSAIAKCLSAIKGMEIWFEPFVYAHFGRDQYRKKYGEDGPMEYEGNEEKMAQAAELVGFIAQSKISPERIAFKNAKQWLEQTTSKYVFAKDMSFSFSDQKSRDYIPVGYKHVFLIRDPFRVLYSYRSAIYKHLSQIGVLKGDAQDEKKYHVAKDDPVNKADEFFTELHDLWRYIRENHDPNPIVVNADDLLTNPAEVLQKFCEQTGLPYSDSLLRWDASTDSVLKWKAAGDSVVIDTVAFFGTAMKSSEFLPPRKPRSREELTTDILEIGDVSMPFFDEMNSHKI